MNPSPQSIPAPKESQQLRGMAALVLLAVVWGGSIPLMKIGLRDLPPLTLTALRYVFAVPFFAVVLRGSWPALLRYWPSLTLLGALNALVGQVLQTVGVRYTTATAATLLSSTIPLWFVALASSRLGQPLRPRQWLGALVAMGGVGLLVVGDVADLQSLWQSETLIGNLFMLLSAVAVAVYFVFTSDLTRRLPAVLVAGGTTVTGALWLLPFGIWEASRTPLAFTPAAAGIVLYLSALVTFAGLMVWLTALQRVPAGIAGSLQYLQPLVGVGLSAWLLGEKLDVRFAAGAVLILAGIAITTARNNR